LGFSLAGAVSRNLRPLGGPHSRAAGYAVVIAFEWIIVAFIWYALSRRGISMRELIGGRWEKVSEILRDLGIGIAFLLVCGFAMVSGILHLLKAAPNQAIREMLPHSTTEIVLWIMMSATAGFCEEIIFRGYFQRQFSALTGFVRSGILLQGLVFGLAHGYQGWKFMLAIAIYGITFGLLAQWRRSLRPGMVAHFVQDSAGGLLARFLTH
jgi:membrane protease YdiL (CAAX protease family)